MADNGSRLINLSWMTDYHTRLKQYLGETYYDRNEIDTLLSQIESGYVQTIRGTKAEIEAMDLSKYPNGTLFVMEG